MDSSFPNDKNVRISGAKIVLLLILVPQKWHLPISSHTRLSSVWLLRTATGFHTRTHRIRVRTEYLHIFSRCPIWLFAFFVYSVKGYNKSLTEQNWMEHMNSSRFHVNVISCIMLSENRFSIHHDSVCVTVTLVACVDDSFFFASRRFSRFVVVSKSVPLNDGSDSLLLYCVYSVLCTVCIECFALFFCHRQSQQICKSVCRQHWLPCAVSHIQILMWKIMTTTCMPVAHAAHVCVCICKCHVFSSTRLKTQMALRIYFSIYVSKYAQIVHWRTLDENDTWNGLFHVTTCDDSARHSDEKVIKINGDEGENEQTNKKIATDSSVELNATEVSCVENKKILKNHAEIWSVHGLSKSYALWIFEWIHKHTDGIGWYSR